MNRKKAAFTLAEVLVVMTIVGIISIETIPVLVKDFQEKQYKIAFKKAYSDMNQIATLMIGDGTFSEVCSTNGSVYFAQELENFFKIADPCGPNHLNQCVNPNDSSEFNYKILNGSKPATYYWFDDGQFIIANGQFVMIDYYYAVGEMDYPMCLAWIDVNGYSKGPNRLGVDVFGVQFLREKLVPLGANDAHNYAIGDCSRSGTGGLSGGECAVKVILEEDY